MTSFLLNLKLSVLFIALLVTQVNGQEHIYISYDQCGFYNQINTFNFIVHDRNFDQSQHLSVRYGNELIVVPFTENNGDLNLFQLTTSINVGSDFSVEYVNQQGNRIQEQFELSLNVLPEFQVLQSRCQSNNDASIEVLKLNDGTIEWENGSTQHSRNNLSSGTYNYTINYNSGCVYNSNIVIEHVEPIEINTAITNYNCQGDLLKTCRVEIMGGTPPYIVDWYYDGIGEDDDTAVLENMPEGLYALRVIDANSCLSEFQVNIDYSDPKSIILEQVDLFPESVENGFMKYDLMESSNLTSGDIDSDGLNGSSYILEFYSTEEDALNSENQLPYVYYSNQERSIIAKLVISNECYEMAPIALRSLPTYNMVLSFSEACDDGSPDLLGGTFSFFDGANLVTENIPPGGTWTIERLVSGGSPIDVTADLITCNMVTGECFVDPLDNEGNYIVTYELGADQYIGSYVVQALNPSLQIIETNICNNVPGVIATANPRGGTLTGAGIISQMDIDDATIYVIAPTGLTAGQQYTYNYTYDFILDSNRSCPQTTSDIIEILPSPTIDITSAPSEACLGEMITLSGIANVSGATTAINWYDPSDNLIGMGDMITLNNFIESGMYRAEAIASNGCSENDFEQISSLGLPDFQCTLTSEIECFGEFTGTISIIINDQDLTGYSYAWDNDGNGTIDFTGSVQSGLPAGNYSITVTGRNGCENTCQIEITEPSLLELTCTIAQETNCFGDNNASLQSTVTGGTPPYQYRWSNGVTNQNLSNLPAGIYALTVTDNNLCEAECSVTIIEPDELIATPSCNFLDCLNDANGTAEVQITGGTPPYSYLWQNGSDQEQISNLGAGNYPVTISDNNGCSTVVVAEVKNPDPIQVTFDGPYDLCLDFMQAINYTISDAALPISQNWTILNPGTTGAENSDIEIVDANNILFNSFCLAEGTVVLQLQIIDANMCIYNETIEINLSSCFDLAIRKTINPNFTERNLGDTVNFIIDVFNQGTIDAFNVTVTDYLQFPLNFNPSINTASYTGNPSNWIISGDNIELDIPRINAGDEFQLEVNLVIDNTFTELNFLNYAEITYFESEIKPLPIDEDDPDPNQNTVELDDDIEDDSNGSADNPFDDDHIDFARGGLCTSSIFSCNNLINISVNRDCEALIRADDFIDGQINIDFIEVSLEDLAGNRLSNPVDFSVLGDTIIAQARDLCSDAQCWSYLIIEDKLPIEIVCPDTLFLSCMQIDTDLNSILPLGNDNCEQLERFIISDVYEECPDITGITQTRTIRFYSYDQFGNTSDTCEQIIHYRAINYFDITVPTDTILSCTNSDNWDTNGNQYPDIAEVELPQFAGSNFIDGDLSQDNLCLININYTDLLFDRCSSTFSVERTWTYIDWCNGLTRFNEQIISIVDNEGPVVSCGQEYNIQSNAENCTADINIQPFGNGIGSISLVTDCTPLEDINIRLEYLVNSQLNNDDAWIDALETNNLPEFRIRGLEFGINWVRYIFTDACGNTSVCNWEINVIDSISPNVVCDEFTQVVLDDTGWATMHAQSIDDGSFDDCSATKIAVRRLTNACNDPNTSNPILFSSNNNAYFEHSFFCCSDLNSDFVEVELVAWDENQNFSTCIAKVQVIEKSTASLQCTTFETEISCLDNPESYFIEPTVLNSTCQSDYLVITNDTTSLSCNQSRYQRNYKLYDNNDILLDECIQIVNRISNTTLEQIVSFPSDQIITCTDSDYNPENNPTLDVPIINATPCNAIGVTYTDKVFEYTDEYCKKILRTWVVTEHCSGEINYLFGDQLIYVSNSIVPNLDCQDQFHEIISNDCYKNISVSVNAYDDCTPNEDLKYLYSIDIDNNNTTEASGFESSFNYQFPPGNHTINWSVTDLCGNTNTCVQNIEVVDAKNPTPYCIGSLNISLQSLDNTVELWAKDLDLESTDNCDDMLYYTFNPWQPVDLNQLHYYKPNADSIFAIIATQEEYQSGLAELWDPNQSSSSVFFDCFNIGSNNIKVFVHDLNGNYDYCSSNINIQDPLNHCGATRNIQGIVTSTNAIPLEGVNLELLSPENVLEIEGSTDATGSFQFTDVEDQKYHLIAKEESNYLEGISTLDLVKIQNHIIGKDRLNKQTQLLAADIDGNQKISTIDLIELRKLILGIYDKLPNVNSWHFFDTTIQLTEPWDIPHAISMQQRNHVDITGVKIGDVNESFSTNFKENQLERRQYATVNINTYTEYEEGLTTINFEIDSEAPLIGLQMSLKLETDIEPILECLDPSASMQYFYDDTELRIVLTSDKPLKRDFLKLQLENNGYSYNLELSEQRFFSEAYDSSYSISKINLQHRESDAPFKLFQNKPNPFDETTVVDIESLISQDSELSIYNAYGALVSKRFISLSQGMNEIKLNSEDFSQQKGVFIIHLRVGGQEQSLKAIRL